jgi:phage protein D
MSVVSLAQESVDQHGFYSPQFEVKIEGVGLPRDVLRDVTQLTYKDNIKEIDSFEITVNNWDPTTRSFKYVGGETRATLDGDTPEARRFKLFEPCNKEIEVRIGYGGSGDLRLMLRGTFTTMEPNFSSGGAPTLTVRGLNVLHQLRRKQYTTTWGDKRDSEIAENIATLVDKELGAKHKRFPLPIKIDKHALSTEKPIVYVAQSSQYDIDFLLGRARERGYVVYVLEADPQGRGEEKQRRLYFGPSQANVPALRDVTFKLKWGASLIDFKPTLTTANQIKSVTVNGWDRAKKKAISEKVTLDDKELNVNRDLHELLNKCDPREEIVVDEPVFTVVQAKQRARAILQDRHKEMVKASATCVGLPDLRAGQRVEIDGLGARFSGTYFVTDTTHTIGDSGYITKFNARREDTGKAP